MNEADFRKQGFAGCLYKPFNREELRKVCGQTLQVKWESIEPAKEPEISSDGASHKFNFAILTAFSEDDEEAARQIIRTFIEETRKNQNRITQAINTKSMQELGEIAHKMLPTFTMIEAQEALPSLQWLETHRKNAEWIDKAQYHAEIVLQCIEKVIKEAKCV